MTTIEQIIYSKLLKYSNREEMDESIYINTELKRSIQRIQQEMTILNRFKENPFYRPIEGNVGFLQKVKKLVKRIIRKLNVFYIKPICEQQTHFNCSVTRSSEELMLGEKIINERLVLFENELIDLQNELKNCKKELAELKRMTSVSDDKNLE